MQYANIENDTAYSIENFFEKVHFSMSTSWLEKIYL